MRFITSVPFLCAALAFTGRAHAQCEDPGVMWVKPDNPTRRSPTNIRVLVAVRDTAPGGTVDGTVTNDDTDVVHTIVWEVLDRDPGLADGRNLDEAAVHQALHIGTLDPVLDPDQFYTFDYTFTDLSGEDHGGEQEMRSGPEPDVVSPSLNGRFEVDVTEVAGDESCMFGEDELLFRFVADDLSADGGSADALQTTIWKVTVPDSGGFAMLETGYYTGTTWSAQAARFEGLPDVCFELTASDMFDRNARYQMSHCVVLPGFEVEGDGGPGGDGDFETGGCGCRASGEPPARGTAAAGVSFFLLSWGAAALTRRRGKGPERVSP